MKLLKNLLLMTGGGVLLVSVIMLYGVWQSGGQFLQSVRQLFNAPQPEPQVDVRSVVLQQIRSASELTTAVFTMEAVVPASQDFQVGGFTVGTTKLLYIAHGEVRAGVNLQKIQPESVQVTTDAIQVILPPPQILDSKIDVNRSSVYDYNRGILGLGPDVAPELQARAERAALSKITTAACTDDLLGQANDRAKLVVSQFLDASSDKAITVKIQPPAMNSCPASTSPAPETSPAPMEPGTLQLPISSSH